MTAPLTRARQETEVGEGLAVGCLVLGITATTGQAEPLDRAFSAALESWPWAPRYPRFQRSRVPALAGVLRASTGRRGIKIARWAVSRGLFVPQLRDDEWDLSAACLQIEDSTTIAVRHWVTVANAFVNGLDADLVWRAPPSSALGDQLPV